MRDWTIRAKRVDTNICVTVKMGRMLVTRVILPVVTWPKNLYDQAQVATNALAKAIGVPWEEWDSSELDRVPDEIVKAVNSVLASLAA